MIVTPKKIEHIAEIIGNRCCAFERNPERRKNCRRLKATDNQATCYCMEAAQEVLWHQEERTAKAEDKIRTILIRLANDLIALRSRSEEPTAEQLATIASSAIAALAGIDPTCGRRM